MFIYRGGFFKSSKVCFVNECVRNPLLNRRSFTVTRTLLTVINISNRVMVGRMGTSMLFKGARDLVAIEERILKCI